MCSWPSPSTAADTDGLNRDATYEVSDPRRPDPSRTPKLPASPSTRMETRSPNGRPSLQACREKVRAADLLIAIVAHRYGWVPPTPPPCTPKASPGLNARASLDRRPPQTPPLTLVRGTLSHSTKTSIVVQEPHDWVLWIIPKVEKFQCGVTCPCTSPTSETPTPTRRPAAHPAHNNKTSFPPPASNPATRNPPPPSPETSNTHISRP